MKKYAWIVAGVLVVLALVVWLEPTGVMRGYLKGDRFYGGRPSSYWAQEIVHEDPGRQEEARSTLTEGGEQSVDVLIALLEETEDADWSGAEVRWRAAEILGDIGPDAESAWQPLLAALKDPDLHVRDVAAATIPKVDTPAKMAVEALDKAVAATPRRAPIRALSEYGEQAAPAIPTLIEVLKNTDLDTETRWNAARTLGKIRASAVDAIPDLVEHLKDEARTVREHCAEALGDIGPPASAAVKPLIAVLDDEYVRVRRDAARSLGQIGPAAAAAVPALKPLLEDPEEIVRSAARTAIGLIDPDEPLPPKK